MPRVELRGSYLHFETTGSGFPLLLIPGVFGQSSTDFASQIESFAQSFEVIAVDPRGYGQSRPPERDFSGDFFHRDAADMAALMAHLGHESYAVLGWSDGGIVALILAAKARKAVRALVTCAANAYLTAADLAFLELIRDPFTWSLSAQMRVAYIERMQFGNLWNQYCERMAAISNDGGDICTDLLKKIDCPSLIVHGATDPVTARDHAQFLCEHIRKAVLWVVPGAGHELHRTHAVEFNAKVRAFLTGATRPGPRGLSAKRRFFTRGAS